MRCSFFRRAKERFVGGETLEEVIAVCKKIHGSHLKTSVDYLGENVTTVEQTEKTKHMYLTLLTRIKEENLDSHVSVKVTALGLDIDERLCQKNLEEITQAAKNIDSFIRIDMEGSAYTERTLQIYHQTRQKYENVGAVIQAMLYRSKSDVEKLIKEDIASIRLCKGAYLEPSTLAFQKKKNVDKNYLLLAKLLLESMYTNNVFPAFATHDETMINFIKVHAKKIGLPPTWFEFQMLYGIREDLQKKLVNEGYTIRVYVPFGEDWYGYFLRRLAERPANIWFVMKNMLKS